MMVLHLFDQIKSLPARHIFFKTIIIVLIIFLPYGCIPFNQTDTLSASSLPSPTQPENESDIEILDPLAYQKVLKNQYTSVSKIQGAAHISPYYRKNVTDVLGVVTVVKADGFYMQSPFPDFDEKTSEGLFIFLKKPPLVKVGDWVFVSGKVAEFYPGGIESGNLTITEIENPQILVVSRGNLLPEAVVLGLDGRSIPSEVIDDDNKKSFDMEDGLDFYESLESMLVQINDAICIGPSSAYNEFTVLADGGRNATGRNSRGGITITEKDFNPERILVDDGLTSLPQVNVADTFSDPIVGVVDYSFGSYKVQAIKKIKVVPEELKLDVASEAGKADLVIVSMNVENLSAADPDERFSRLANIILENLKTPDIIALQEIQDDNGIVDDKETSARKTSEKIIEHIVKDGGPEYKYFDIAPDRNKDGGQPGGNIRVGFLYRGDRSLDLVESGTGVNNVPAEFVIKNGAIGLFRNPARVDPLNYVFVDSRKSLVAEFMYNGQRIFIINNHWNSKGSDTPLFGNSQPPLLLSENQRIGQARSIADFVDSALQLDEHVNVFVLGDLNDFYFSKSLRELEKVGMKNLFFNLPIEERYTYNYEGNAQNLDNVLVSSHLIMYIKQIEVIHINSEYSYRQRFSDHDPIRIVINFN